MGYTFLLFLKFFLNSLGMFNRFLHIDFPYFMLSYSSVFYPFIALVNVVFLSLNLWAGCLEGQLFTVSRSCSLPQETLRDPGSPAPFPRPHSGRRAGSQPNQATAILSSFLSHSCTRLKELGLSNERKIPQSTLWELWDSWPFVKLLRNE